MPLQVFIKCHWMKSSLRTSTLFQHGIEAKSVFALLEQTNGNKKYWNAHAQCSIVRTLIKPEFIQRAIKRPLPCSIHTPAYLRPLKIITLLHARNIYFMWQQKYLSLTRKPTMYINSATSRFVEDVAMLVCRLLWGKTLRRSNFCPESTQFIKK